MTDQLPTVTRTVTRLVAKLEPEDCPDLSWLDQTDDEMGEGFEAHARERKDAYERGDWSMVGVVVTAYDERGHELANDALWMIESDSEPDYFRQVAAECAAQIAADLGVDLSAVPFDYFGES